MFGIAIIAAILGGGSCGMLGYYVQRFGVTTLSFSIAHAALAGAAVGMVFGVDMIYSAMLFATTYAIVMGFLMSKTEHARELISMAFFAFFNALAIFMIYISNTTVLATSSVATILWGSVLAVTLQKIAIFITLLILFIYYVFAFKPQIDSILFDKKLAEAEGIDVHLHTIVILVFVSIVIALTLKITGGFLVFSLLYNPVASAFQISRRANLQQIISPTLGISSALLGLAISYILDWPVGATIAIISTLILFISVIYRLIINILALSMAKKRTASL
ncbi:MAG TPA: metal ABC transporter permease [Thermoprotei archaeon]|nr:metal ABC transporter permease [Thermoprotei archaeon]